VFGARIVERSLQREQPWPTDMPTTAGFAPDLRLELPTRNQDNGGQPELADLQQTMWNNVGLVRNAEGLRQAVEQLGRWQSELANQHNTSELFNLAQLGWLMAHAALARNESRGGHYRSDAPSTKAAWRRRIVLAYSSERAAAQTRLAEAIA
jgi:L-aspartate oxidase